MGAYILKRLALVIPTLFGIMLINFFLTNFVPGGPLEQIEARIQGSGDSIQALGGGGGDMGMGEDQGGVRGLPPELRARLEVQFGFARFVCKQGTEGPADVTNPDCVKEDIPQWERFLIMMGNYLRFDFGESYFRSISVVDLVLEKMPVSITLGLWSTLIAYLVSIPLGIRKAVREGSSFDAWTSRLIILAYAIPSFLFAILLMVLFAGGSYWQIFPLRGLLSDGLDAAVCLPWNGGAAGFLPLTCLGTILPDYLWHIALPVTALVMSSFATLTMLTKNSFLDEIRKQYVNTARAKGLSETRVLYGHVFRNAMLIVIAGFPATFLGVFFGSSLIIEMIFSLDGLGQLGFRAAVERDYAVMFGTLYAFGLISLLVGILSDLMYVLVDPRIDFSKRAG